VVLVGAVQVPVPQVPSGAVVEETLPTLPVKTRVPVLARLLEPAVVKVELAGTFRAYDQEIPFLTRAG
jgi:hypothetical protein